MPILIQLFTIFHGSYIQPLFMLIMFAFNHYSNRKVIFLFRYSHGFVVSVDDLLEYIEANYE